MKTKNFLMLLLLLFVGLQTTWAQAFRVYQSDGTLFQFSLKTDSIVFDNGLSGDEVFGPFTPVNLCIAKTWYKSKTETVTFNADGTTDYMEGATYEFMPYQGNIIIYNASNVPKSILKVYKLTSEAMLVGKPGSNDISVWSIDKPVYLVKDIQLSEMSIALSPDETHRLTATVLPTDADNPAVAWASSNDDVATVINGLVVAIAPGTCTITCSATDGSGVKAECQVTVLNGNSGTLDGHVYVDLGLPSGTLWATCNVGANSPEEYGDYYAWGETEPKNEYSWITYKYCKGSYDTMTKYCTSTSEGAVDNKTELEPSDDAATANWGSGWQMPSREQCDELYNSSYTTTTWTTMNGVEGRMITSKSNGNSIFLPAAGGRYGTSLDKGSYGYCWSRSLDTSSIGSAYCLYFDSNNDITDSNSRSYGRSVRPVRVNGVQTVAVSNIELSQTELSVKVGETTQLSATVLPADADNPAVAWASSNADVATVINGLVVAIAPGTCTITCSATDGSGVKAECKVTVKNDNSGTLDGHDYVDLGLPSGTLWATCNVGASNPEKYGGYFAWGETTTKAKGTYSWTTYKYCKDSYDTQTKYCTSGSYGTVDNKIELEPSDDAATVNWGSGWQMPSLEQFKELINSNYTTTTWTTLNGVNGYEITSKSNGNSIFLPAAGYSDGTGLGRGSYWSRSLDTSRSDCAYSLNLGSSSIGTGHNIRYDGKSVRPVRVKK